MSTIAKLTESDVKIIPLCFERAVVRAFDIQLTSKVAIKNVSMRPDSTSSMSIDCMSTVMLQSKNLSGNLSIAFPSETFFALLKRMLDETATEISAENSDASGEMLNIIYSTGRKEINEGGFDFTPSLPATVFGKNLALAKSNMSGIALYTDCECDLGRFAMMLSLRNLT